MFEFCWYLFLCAKSEYPDNSVELVTAFHMLLCCVDLVFANVINDKREDLVNTKFSAIPENWLETKTTSANEKNAFNPICIMSSLCTLHDGSFVDAMVTKTYAWRKIINKYIAMKVLKCDKQFLGLILTENFEYNLNSLKKHYESYVLSVGEIDEGILLAQAADNTSKHLFNILPQNLFL